MRSRQNRSDSGPAGTLVVIARYSPRKQAHDSGRSEKVQISIQSGDDPNQRIRIANTLIDARGEVVPLKRGAAVHIVIRPKPKNTIW